MNHILIIQINVRVPDTFFNGTIFDGKLIQNNNDYIFLIQDCFFLMGNNLLNMEMKQKITHLDSIFKTHFNKNMNYCNNFSFKLNKLYDYSELSDLIQSLPTIKILNNGITFFPKLSGINVVHIETKADKKSPSILGKISEKIDNKSYHIIYNFSDFLKNRNYSYESNGKNSQLWLTRTLIPDVYDISENENSTKLGIAHIPNLKTSHMCDDIIKEKPIKFNCIFCTKFKKWIPLNII
jgi:hypothetical protein